MLRVIIVVTIGDKKRLRVIITFHPLFLILIEFCFAPPNLRLVAFTVFKRPDPQFVFLLILNFQFWSIQFKFCCFLSNLLRWLLSFLTSHPPTPSYVRCSFRHDPISCLIQ